jgi:hypothetical protein
LNIVDEKRRKSKSDKSSLLPSQVLSLNNEQSVVSMSMSISSHPLILDEEIETQEIEAQEIETQEFEAQEISASAPVEVTIADINEGIIDETIEEEISKVQQSRQSLREIERLEGVIESLEAGNVQYKYRVELFR